MARPKKDPTKAPTKDRILAAAEEVFALEGYHSANLADIAAKVGIRRPSLLYHYSDKKSLYKAVVTQGFRELRTAVARGISLPGEFPVRVVNIVDALVKLADQRVSLIQIIAREMVEPGQKAGPVIDEFAEMIDVLTTFLETQGEGYLRTDIPIRAAVHSLTSSYLLRATGKTHAKQLWGGGDPTIQLALASLMKPIP